MDSITTILFSKTPRDVGNPFRTRVKNFKEFKNFVEMQNGFTDVFVSLYDDAKIIDKLWFDIDAKNLEESLHSAKKLYKQLKDKGLDFHVIFSGSKGFHFYILVEDYIPPNIETGKVLLMQAFQQLTEGIEHLDQQIRGDINRLVRVPGSIHPKTGKYCTYLPDDFINWSAQEVAQFSSKFFIGGSKPRYKLNEIVDFNLMYRATGMHEYIFQAQSHSIPEDVLTMLKSLIRPCIVSILEQDREPPHSIRTTFVAELGWLGYKEDKIVDICKKLNWSDFDEKVTRYHTKQILKKKLFPMSTKRLHELIDCNCNWTNWWYEEVHVGKT